MKNKRRKISMIAIILTALIITGVSGVSGIGLKTVYSQSYALGTHVSSLDTRDDGYAGPYDIGFDFSFYGKTQTQFYVTTNGTISFEAGDYMVSNLSLPDKYTEPPFIAPYWDDLSPGRSELNSHNGYIIYKSFEIGEADNPYGERVLVVQWTNYNNSWAYNEKIGTFQAHLVADGRITFNYNDLISLSGARSATIGIQGDTNNYLQHSYYSDHNLASKNAISFIPDGMSYIKEGPSPDGFWDLLLSKSETTQPPTKPINPVPSPGSLVNNNVFLSWIPSEGATSYEVAVYSSDDLSDVSFLGKVTEPYCLVENLFPGTTYYWVVSANNEGGTQISDTWQFKTYGDITATEASNIGNYKFTANWEAVEGAAGYRLSVYDNPNLYFPLSNYREKDVGNVTIYDITGLTPGKTYYYKVYAYKSIKPISRSYISYSSESNLVSVTTEKLDQTISFEPLPVKTYGDASFALGAQATSGLSVNYTSSDTKVAEVKNNQINIKGAGSAIITANQSGNSMYKPAESISQVLTVNKKDLTIGGSFLVQDRVYDGTTNALITENNLTLEGLVYSDVLTLNPVAEFSDKNVGGSKQVNLSGSTSLQPNIKSGVDIRNHYNFILVGAPVSSANITPRELGLSELEVADKTYDGSTGANATLITSNHIDGDDISYTYDVNFSNPTAGINKDVIFEWTGLSGIDAINYTLSEPITINANIHPKQLSVINAIAEDKVYDGTNIATISGSTLNGVVGDDIVELTNHTVGIFTQKVVGTDILVSTNMGITGIDASNYILTQPEVKADITKKGLIIKAEDKNKIYGSVDPGLTVSYDGFVLDEDSSLISDLIINRDAGENVDEYAITPSLATADNYEITYEAGIFKINKKDLVIKADDKSKVYGDMDPEFTVSYDGFAYEDDSSCIRGLKFTRGTGENVGDYVITLSEAVADNYNINFETGKLSINKKALVIKADDKTKVYGSDDPSYSASYTGFAFDDDASIIGGLEFNRTIGENVGTYQVTPFGATASNYSISYEIGNLSITKKSLLITVNDATKTYGSKDPIYSFEYDGFAFDDDEAIVSGLVVSRITGEGAGLYILTPLEANAENYEISYNAGTLTITKKPLVIKADDKSKVYGDMDPEFTVSYDGFAYDDDSSCIRGLKFTRGAGENAGDYVITPSEAVADNYTINFEAGKLSINKKALVIKADDKTKVYGSDDPSYSASYAGFAFDDDASIIDGLEFNRTIGENVGTYQVTPFGATASNYNISYELGNLSITKKSLLITVNDATKTYGSKDPIYSFEYDGLAFDDNEAVVSGLVVSRITGEGAGLYILTPSDANAENYEISYNAGALTITKKPLDIKADDKSKVYGDMDPEFTVSYDGFVNDDGSSCISGLKFTRVAGENVGEYIITPSEAVADNYTINFETGKLSINKKALVIKADDKTKVYGSDDPDLTFVFDGFTNEDDSSVVSGLDVSREPGENVGIYKIIISGCQVKNYNIEYKDATLTITKKDLLIKAENKSKIYGAGDPEFTATYEGFVYSDDNTSVSGLIFDREDGETVGTYNINLKNATSNNYNISYQSGNFDILDLNELYTGGTVSDGDSIGLGNVEYVATPKEGYEFAYWINGNEIVSDDIRFSFIAGTYDDLKPVFLEVSEDEELGTYVPGNNDAGEIDFSNHGIKINLYDKNIGGAFKLKRIETSNMDVPNGLQPLSSFISLQSSGSITNNNVKLSISIDELSISKEMSLKSIYISKWDEQKKEWVEIASDEQGFENIKYLWANVESDGIYGVFYNASSVVEKPNVPDNPKTNMTNYSWAMAILIITLLGMMGVIMFKSKKVKKDYTD